MQNNPEDYDENSNKFCFLNGDQEPTHCSGRIKRIRKVLFITLPAHTYYHIEPLDYFLQFSLEEKRKCMPDNIFLLLTNKKVGNSVHAVWNDWTGVLEHSYTQNYIFSIQWELHEILYV